MPLVDILVLKRFSAVNARKRLWTFMTLFVSATILFALKYFTTHTTNVLASVPDLMLLVDVLVLKRFFTVNARKCLWTCMILFVSVLVTFAREFFSTHPTLERFLFAMCQEVFPQVSLRCKRLCTFDAWEWITIILQFMFLLIPLVCKTFPTVSTWKWLFSWMDTSVSCQCSWLSKWHVANAAWIWFQI